MSGLDPGRIGSRTDTRAHFLGGCVLPSTSASHRWAQWRGPLRGADRAAELVMAFANGGLRSIPKAARETRVSEKNLGFKTHKSLIFAIL